MCRNVTLKLNFQSIVLINAQQLIAEDYMSTNLIVGLMKTSYPVEIYRVIFPRLFYVCRNLSTFSLGCIPFCLHLHSSLKHN